MGQGDVPASLGGPLRRRRERRQLGRLADKSDRDVSPTAAKAHVWVIEDQPSGNEEVEPEEQEENTPSMENRPRGFHVRPIPIDQPFSEAYVQSDPHRRDRVPRPGVTHGYF